MGTTGKPKKKQPDVRNSSRLVHALKAVKSGEMTCNAAAKKYRMSQSTLQRYVNGKYKDIVKNTARKNRSNSYLTGGEERSLIVHLQLLGMVNLEIGILELCHIAGNIVRKKKKDPDHKNPSKKWGYKFLKKYKVDLNLRKANNIVKRRADITADDIKEYHKNLTVSLEGVPPTHILNYDEKPFT